MTQQPEHIRVSEADAAGKPTDFRRVGVLYHPHKPHSRNLADEIARDLNSKDVDTWIGLSRDAAAVAGRNG